MRVRKLLAEARRGRGAGRKRTVRSAHTRTEPRRKLSGARRARRKQGSSFHPLPMTAVAANFAAAEGAAVRKRRGSGVTATRAVWDVGVHRARTVRAPELRVSAADTKGSVGACSRFMPTFR